MYKEAPGRLARALAESSRNDRGNVAVLFAVALLPILLGVGAAIDYGRAHETRNRLQAALDATALMLAHDLGTLSEAQIKDRAAQVFAVNFAPHPGVVTQPLEIAMTGDNIRLAAKATLDTALMGLAGINTLDVGSISEVVRANDSYEVVLVLDNTGSMSGAKIKALKSATEDLVNILFGNYDVHPQLKMALVPFSNAVNVGTANANAAWMDTKAQNPIHGELFDSAFKSAGLTRFQLYDRIKNVSWPGCVEARKYPYDVTDASAWSADPDSLFVPYFHPDEPGNAGKPANTYQNSYLHDGVANNASDETKQKSTAKYANGVTATQSGSASYGLGPAYGCTAKPILPLTDQKQAVLDAADGMEANGYTNIAEGLMWGWRVISPDAPFTEGEPYGKKGHQKIIILLTDGQNQLNGANNFNKSMYSAYGYIGSGRLGTTSSSTSTIQKKMDERTAEACSNVKAKGVKVFTITFQVGDATTEKLMRDCATDKSMYFDSPDTATLSSVFKTIASKITQLRLSR